MIEPEIKIPTKEEIQDSIRQAINSERMLQGMIRFLKLEEMVLDVLPDLFVFLLKHDEGIAILNRLDKNGKITQFIGKHSP